MDVVQTENFLIGCLLGRNPLEFEARALLDLRKILFSLNQDSVNFVKDGFYNWYQLKCKLEVFDSSHFNLSFCEYALTMCLSGNEDIVEWNKVMRQFYSQSFKLPYFLNEFFPQGVYRLGQPSLDWPMVNLPPQNGISDSENISE